MYRLLIPILAFLISGFHGSIVWDASGCGCSVQSVSSCSTDSTDQMAACGDLAGDTHSHRMMKECMASGGACTCSMQPSDVPRPSSDQPMVLQQLSSVAAVPARLRVVSVVLLRVPRVDSIHASLSRVPPSNGQKQALLSVWRT